jgi:DinB superfamily
MNIQELAAAYESATNEFLAIATSVAENQLDINDGENWSSRQVIHHCADSEAQSYARLRRLVAEPNPVIQGYDEGQWAKDATLGYTTLPVENSIAVFKAVRAGSLDIIKRLKPEQLELTGTHTEAGEYSLKRWLETYTRHANNHAEQIKQNLAL